jgi:hypothetical protein
MCIDGGATSHMVPLRLQEELNILESYTEYQKPKRIIVGGAHFYFLEGREFWISTGTNWQRHWQCRIFSLF